MRYIFTLDSHDQYGPFTSDATAHYFAGAHRLMSYVVDSKLDKTRLLLSPKLDSKAWDVTVARKAAQAAEIKRYDAKGRLITPTLGML